MSDAPHYGINIAGGTGHSIQRNYIYNCGHDDVEEYPGLIVIGKHWDEQGIDIIATNSTVAYNLIVNCSIGIVCEGQDGLTTSGIRFYNNTISGTDRPWSFITLGMNENITFKNNI